MLNILKGNSPIIDPIEVLVEEIITQANLQSLPVDDKKYLQDNLSLQINRRLGLIIMDNLNEEGIAEYNKLTAEGLILDPAKLEILLANYIPNYQEKIQVGLDEFVKQILIKLTKRPD